MNGSWERRVSHRTDCWHAQHTWLPRNDAMLHTKAGGMAVATGVVVASPVQVPETFKENPVCTDHVFKTCSFFPLAIEYYLSGGSCSQSSNLGFLFIAMPCRSFLTHQLPESRDRNREANRYSLPPRLPHRTGMSDMAFTAAHRCSRRIVVFPESVLFLLGSGESPIYQDDGDGARLAKWPRMTRIIPVHHLLTLIYLPIFHHESRSPYKMLQRICCCHALSLKP